MSERPLRHPDSSFRKIGAEGGLVVLPGKAEVKVLNPVAIRIFPLLDGRHTRSQIVAAVCEEFDVDQQRALRDIDAFLGELASHGMLVDTAGVTGEGQD